MKVVDTNVLLYFYIPGDHTKETEALFQSDPEWTAPYLWRSEFRNVLSLYVRQKLLKEDQALEIAKEAEKLMEGREFMVSSESVLSLAFSSKLSAYDCEFVALAKKLGASLVTSDKQILTHFPSDTLALNLVK